MKICVPINKKSNISKLITLGTDEFYCGYLFRKNHHLNSILSRHKGEKANFQSKEDIYSIKEQNAAAKKTIHITINEHFFPKIFLPPILDDIGDFLRHGICHFIISDINLLLLIRKKFPQAHLTASTGTHIMNSNAACFLKELGISRIILPRHLTFKEILAIINAAPDMEFELFVKNTACPNIDGFCSSLHGPIGERNFRGLCHELQFKEPPIQASRRLNDTACAACHLWALIKQRNQSVFLKIVGRSSCHNELIENDVLFFHVLRNMRPNFSREHFRAKVKTLYKKIYRISCPRNCYY